MRKLVVIAVVTLVASMFAPSFATAADCLAPKKPQEMFTGYGTDPVAARDNAYDQADNAAGTTWEYRVLLEQKPLYDADAKCWTCTIVVAWRLKTRDIPFFLY
jgi:hypothetical protein